MVLVGEDTCMICGILLWENPIRYKPERPEDPPDWNPHDWRTIHILLSGPTWQIHEKGPKSMNIPDQSVTVHIAHVSSDGIATISSTGLTVGLPREGLHMQQPGHDPSDGHHWYLCLHAACEAIARKAMTASESKV